MIENSIKNAKISRRKFVAGAVVSYAGLVDRRLLPGAQVLDRVEERLLEYNLDERSDFCFFCMA
jgi:hypothetical protein